ERLRPRYSRSSVLYEKPCCCGGQLRAVTIRPLERLPRRSLRCVPRRALPRGAGRACGRVLHAGPVEGRTPAALLVLCQLQVEALAVRSHGNVPDAGAGVDPTAARAPSSSLARPCTSRLDSVPHETSRARPNQRIDEHRARTRTNLCPSC